MCLLLPLPPSLPSSSFILCILVCLFPSFLHLPSFVAFAPILSSVLNSVLTYIHLSLPLSILSAFLDLLDYHWSRVINNFFYLLCTIVFQEFRYFLIIELHCYYSSFYVLLRSIFKGISKLFWNQIWYHLYSTKGQGGQKEGHRQGQTADRKGQGQKKGQKNV